MTKAPGSKANARETIVMVRWALIIACAYLILFSDGGARATNTGLVVIAAFLASNLVAGRLPQEYFATRTLKVGIAAVDTVFITVSVYLAHQLSVEVLLLLLAVVVLASAGLELAVIARVTLALSVADVVLIWLTGSAPVWRTSMLLRVPFLLSVSLVYGALVEAGLGDSPNLRRQPLVALDMLTTSLSAQRAAIERCQAALSGNGSSSVALSALNEVADQNLKMQTTIGRL
jgi:hypothetical protein